ILQDLNANTIHKDVINVQSAGTTLLVSSPPKPGKVTLGRRIQNYTGTESSKEIHHVLQDEATGGNGSVVHNLYGNFDTTGKYTSSIGGMDQANAAMALGLNQKSQKKDESLEGKSSTFKSSLDTGDMTESGPPETFTMPNGEDKTFLNVFNGNTRINNMATVVKQAGNGDTTGDTFLKNSEVNQYDVVVQTVPGARAQSPHDNKGFQHYKNAYRPGDYPEFRNVLEVEPCFPTMLID
ncbi:unnamed protein product, partial [Allacma fusca]